MTNVHRVQVGKEGIIIGANILSFAILSELQLAGIKVDHIVLPERSELSQKAGEPEEVLTLFKCSSPRSFCFLANR